MTMSNVALFDLADQRLAWIGQRQSVLAQNIANADTPGWKSRDITPFSTVLSHAEVTPAQTDPHHLGRAPGGPGGARPAVTEHAPDGNAVSLDHELVKLAQTQSDHELVGDLYKKYLSFFRTAIGR